MDPSSLDFDENANINNYDCSYAVVSGCMDPNYLEYNPEANANDNSCDNIIVTGCTNPTFMDYNIFANVDDGSCQSLQYSGCLDPNYQEYDSVYTISDQSACITPHIYGCTDPNSIGGTFNPYATQDDGSCILIGCSDSAYAEYYNQGYTQIYLMKQEYIMLLFVII